MSLSTKSPKMSPIKIMQNRIYELLKQGKRIDGRAPHEVRPVSISTSVIEKADGSAMVSMGGTKILTGIKVETGTPYSDRPNEGVFTVNAELLPLASASFEPGPPDERAVELARIVDRCIRESRAIDLEKLVITEGEKVYMLYIDIYVLDYDGNYFDPAVLSAVAALATCKIPRYEMRNGKLERVEGESMKTPIRTIPVSVMIGVIQDRLLVDPSPMEERALDTSVILGYDSDSNIVSIQKNTPGLLSLNMMEQIIELGSKKAEELRSILVEAVGLGS